MWKYIKIYTHTSFVALEAFDFDKAILEPPEVEGPSLALGTFSIAPTLS